MLFYLTFDSFCKRRPWEPMGTHESPWEPMGTLGSPWEPMGTHGSPWEPMGTHGSPWEPMEGHESPWEPIRDHRRRQLENRLVMLRDQSIQPGHPVKPASQDLTAQTHLWETSTTVQVSGSTGLSATTLRLPERLSPRPPLLTIDIPEDTIAKDPWLKGTIPPSALQAAQAYRCD